MRYLAAALPATGWDARIVAGSAGGPEDPRNARRFFAGLDVHPVDYSSALAVAAGGGDPLDLDVPLQPRGDVVQFTAAPRDIVTILVR